MITTRYGAVFAALFLVGAAEAVLLAGPALATPGTSAAGSAVVDATAPSDSVPVRYTQAGSGNPPSQASVQPSTVIVLAGGTVTFTNTGNANLTLGGALKETVKPGGSIRVPVPANAKDATYAYTATEDIRGLPVPNTVNGQVMAKGTPSSPPSSATSTPPGRSGGSQPPAGGQTAPGATSGPGGPSSGAYVGPALPGGVIAPLAPGATAYPNGPAPLVAPFATSTSTAEPTIPSASSTSSPAATAASSTPSGRSGTRSLGLPAAITAVVLVGVIAALVRVLLTHPAARALPRGH